MNRWRRDADDEHSEATVLEEEHRLSRILGQLPQLDPPAALRGRVMARVQDYESRPRGIRGVFQSLAPARTAVLLACGLAGWVFLTGAPYDLMGTGFGGEPRVVSREGSARSIERGARRAPQHRPYLQPRYAVPAGALAIPSGLFRGEPTPVQAGRPVLPTLDHRLDRQIDHLLHNPDAFFRRFAQIRENDRYLERLANRSARRGDAANVGLRVRAIQHPMAPQVSERFLKAPLIRASARR